MRLSRQRANPNPLLASSQEAVASPMMLAGQSSAYLKTTALHRPPPPPLPSSSSSSSASSAYFASQPPSSSADESGSVTKDVNIQATLSHIAGQLDLIMKTMQIMDERLTHTENRVSNLLSLQRGVNPVPVQNEWLSNESHQREDDREMQDVDIRRRLQSSK